MDGLHIGPDGWVTLLGSLGWGARAPQRVCLVADAADGQSIEPDPPIAGLCLFKGDRFSGQSRADVNEAAAPLNLTVGAHLPDGGLVGVVGLGQALGKRSRRGLVEGDRRQLAQGFMRALLVVVLAEGGEALGLVAMVGGRRPHGFPQSEGEALMAPVLLRLARLDALVADAELGPPHPKAGERGDACRSKGRAVVGAERPGQAELGESPLG